MQDYHLVDIRHEKVSPFVKFEIILPLFCFLLDPLTSKHCRTWSSMINFSICTFLSSNIIYLGQRRQLKSNFLDFQVLESKFIKLLMSVLKWQVSSSSNFALLFIVMTHNSSVNFKGTAFLLWTKGSHQSPNFDTFECSGENLPNSSCHFPHCITPQCIKR